MRVAKFERGDDWHPVELPAGLLRIAPQPDIGVSYGTLMQPGGKLVHFVTWPRVPALRNGSRRYRPRPTLEFWRSLRVSCDASVCLGVQIAGMGNSLDEPFFYFDLVPTIGVSRKTMRRSFSRATAEQGAEAVFLGRRESAILEALASAQDGTLPFEQVFAVYMQDPALSRATVRRYVLYGWLNLHFDEGVTITKAGREVLRRHEEAKRQAQPSRASV